MNAKNLANELLQGFLSALRAAPEQLDSVGIAEIMRACANNTAQALADRTIDSDTANMLAEVGLDLSTVVANALFAHAAQLENEELRRVATP